MNTDRELLELAAKAAGINVVWSELAECFFLGEECMTPWNPRDDSGDALRLAIALRINIETFGNRPAAVFLHPKRNRFIHFREDQTEHGMEKAICLAIVRAAAEIGESMP